MVGDTLSLATPIHNIRFIGPVYATRLAKLAIHTVYDLLTHFPTRYDDFSVIASISTLQPGETVTIQGRIKKFKNAYTKNGKIVQQAEITDSTGSIKVIWFNQPFLSKVFRVGMIMNLAGTVDWFGRDISMVSPEYEIVRSNGQSIHTGRLVPVYPETAGVSSKWLRSRIWPLLSQFASQFIEFLPETILNTNNFLLYGQAIQSIHFPKTVDDAQRARERLSFDELFIIQLASFKRRMEWQKEVVGHRFEIATHKEKISQFWEKLPFTLTSAQKKAVSEIFADLARNEPMNRLLEGDVGSGKTVVAAIALYVTFLNGYQGVLMAPTEILAQQHYRTIKDLLEPIDVQVELRTSSSKRKQESGSKNQESDIVIGTHALLSKSITYDRLGLIVIDEQQRFGVAQRATLREKGVHPHLLSMTATPIPRTVALALYGELDLSYLDEMPKGRLKVKTWVVPAYKRQAAYQWIHDQVKKTEEQAFIVCPFIEESESIKTVKAAKQEFEHLKTIIFADLRLGLLHGKLKAKEKESVLQQFKKGEYDILVSTPVVEVGIDIPTATIMMIEGAERFGLSQLHQLRGRVGRSTRSSYCLLFTENTDERIITRLKSLERLYDGAQLAELDLKLRGAGDLYGTRQHGIMTLKIASLADFKTLQKSKEAVTTVINTDSTLLQFPLLRQRLNMYTISISAPD